MNWVKFSLFTFFGSMPWGFALALIGKTLGEHWEGIKVYSRKADIVIAVALVSVIGLWIYRHVREAWGESLKQQSF